MMYLILSLIVGISSAMLVWVVFVIEKDLSPNVLRRLDRIKRKTNYIDSGENSLELDLSKEESLYKFSELEKLMKGSELEAQIKNLLELADSELKIDAFLILSILFAFPFLLFMLTDLKFVAIIGFITFFIPTIYMKYLANKRFLDFAKQFPDALNLMSSSLRAGHPLFTAIDIVTSEMPKPVSSVFQVAQRDISLGRDSKDAFLSMMKVMPKSLDLRFFITAVLIQKEVGGNLAELLDSLSATIRERFKLMGQLRVQTAQTRLSGMILGVVPIFVLLGIFFLNPEYVKPLFTTPDGQIAFAIAIFLMITGFVSVKKISDIEI